MLYYIPYIKHDLEKLHDLILYFFDKVENLNPVVFDKRSLFPLWYSNTPNRLEALEGHLKYFVETLDRQIQLDIINAFRKSNQIEYIFSNKVDHALNIIAIPIALDFPLYQDYLHNLFVTLYKSQLSPKISTFTKKINNLNLYDHYDELRQVAINQKGTFAVCPYCGMEGLKMVDSEGRPDYDHLLPKGNYLFVFSSINLKNLAPTGLICNGFKDTTHLLYTDNTRRTRSISFYPYSNEPDPYSLCDFQLICVEYPTLRSGGKWQVLVVAQDTSDSVFVEKIETWVRVFNIQNRFAEYIQDRGYVMLGNIIEKLATHETEQDLRDKIKTKINVDFDLTYSLIAVIQGLIPIRIFYQWTLNDPIFLRDLFNAKRSPISTVSLSIEHDSPEFEF